MCGIAGLVALQDAPLVAAKLPLQAMLDAIAHRGPDGSGTLVEQPFAFLHRRLSIIDIAGGAQPILSPSGRVALVFNGEIYNFVSLRRELEDKGHRFVTHSDSEVLAAAIEEWGAGALPKLRGMFAFAAYDKSERRLLLARDRLGKKPVYYAVRDGQLAFASNLQALCAWRPLYEKLDVHGIANYLNHGYAGAPRTIFADVHKLQAGHYIALSLPASEAPRQIQYWDLAYEPKRNGARAALQRELSDLIDQSIADRLIADVPIGSFLSSGVDSSLIVCRAAKQLPSLQSFTIGFTDNPAIDERDVAAKVAALAGTRHFTTDAGSEVQAALPNVIAKMGEPFADPSALPTYLIAKAAAAHVKVVLTGDGGDESFAGYRRYLRSTLSRVFAQLPSPARALLIPALARLKLGNSRVAIAAERAERPFSHVYADAMSVFTRDHAYTLARAQKESDAQLIDPLIWRHDENRAQHWLDRLVYTDLKTYLAELVLTKMDNMTMAHGVEARSPLLDHRIVQWAARLPTALKANERDGAKVLLRDVARQSLPQWIIDQRKRGFDIPLDAWMRSGALRDQITSTLSDSQLVRAGWLDRDLVAAEIAPSATGEAPLGNRLWSLYILECWLRALKRAPADS